MKLSLQPTSTCLLARKKGGDDPKDIGDAPCSTAGAPNGQSRFNAAQPQAVTRISACASCAAYFKAARKATFGGMFDNVSFVGAQALFDAVGPGGAGVAISQLLPSVRSKARPLAREFFAAIAAGGNKVNANFSSMEGFMAAKLFAEGLRRATARSPSAFITGLESIRNASVGGFNVSLGAGNHAASNAVELSMIASDGIIRA
ncbi:MAG: ABC transporter substrate-binding protein [Hydrogenophaga sp.]